MPDRIRRGNAVTFPNLYPFDEFHSVATLPRFFTHPGEISVGDMVECLLACFETFKKASQRHPSLKYWILSWNHLPPAGASILHPHLQLVAAREPTRLLQEELQKSRSYYGRTGKIYWQELIRAEKDLGERYIGATGEFHWIASFAPIGNKEVMGLAEHASSLAEAEHAVKDLCQGLHKILRGFSRAGVESFNMSSYSGPLHKKANYFRLHFRIIARPPVAEVYTNDRGFMEVMHGEAVIDTLPEIWAAELRKFF